MSSIFQKYLFICSLLFTSFICIQSSYAAFEGNLSLIPEGCQSTDKCELGEDFGFVDSNGIGWQADKGLKTDGASIPPWAQPIVGKPFEESFIKAAVIHDHYCDRHVRPWRQTHRVFYEALITSNVPQGKAGIMYFAVMIGGPKWLKLIKGNDCSVGDDCVNDAVVFKSYPGSSITLGDDGHTYLSRSNRYGSSRFSTTLAKEIPQLEAQGDGLTREQVEELAANIMSEDVFFENVDSIGSNFDIMLDAQ